VTEPRDLIADPGHFLAFGLGSGLSRYAPGTAGTAAAVPLYLLLAPLGPLWYAVALVVVTVVGAWLCGRASRALGVHDHGAIVIDEFAGYLLTMVGLPATWPWVLAGFVVFRLFDIVKPWPIGWVDRRVGGGVGIMLDDLLAGVYGVLLLQTVAFLIDKGIFL